jgi:hypothetical protein
LRQVTDLRPERQLSFSCFVHRTCHVLPMALQIRIISLLYPSPDVVNKIYKRSGSIDVLEAAHYLVCDPCSVFLLGPCCSNSCSMCQIFSFFFLSCRRTNFSMRCQSNRPTPASPSLLLLKLLRRFQRAW